MQNLAKQTLSQTPWTVFSRGGVFACLVKTPKTPEWQIVTTCKHDSYVFTVFRQMELFFGETLQEIVRFLSQEKEQNSIFQSC